MAHSNFSTTGQNDNRQTGADCNGHQPVWLVPLFDSIPVELKQLHQFLTWKAQKRDSKWTKVPYNARNGNSGSSTNPDTWSSFGEAKAAYERGNFTGIGIAMADQLAGVDLDHCVDPKTGEIAEWAMSIVRDFDTYTEKSPSATGLRILFKGKLPGKGLNRNVNGCHIEMYDQGRFLTLTGHHVKGTPDTIEHRQEVANSRYQWVLDNTGGSKQSAAQPTAQSAFDPSQTDRDLTEEDEALLAGLLRNGALQQIWQGDITGFRSRSEADWRLLCTLVEMTDDDTQVLRLWRASGLNRSKLYRPNGWPEGQIAKARASLTQPLEMPVFDQSPEFDKPADDYDPPISSDEDREAFLRLALTQGSLLTRARMFLAAALGFRKIPWRLLQAIHSFTGNRLIEMSISDPVLATRYAENKAGGISLDTVRRDRLKLKKEQFRVGVELIHITEGSMNFSTKKGVPTRYDPHIDRWALEIIDGVMERRNGKWRIPTKELEKEASRKAREILEASGRSPYKPVAPKKREKKTFETAAVNLPRNVKRQFKELAKIALAEKVSPGKLSGVLRDVADNLTREARKTEAAYFEDFPFSPVVDLDCDGTAIESDADGSGVAQSATVKRGQRKPPQVGKKSENHRYASLHTEMLDFSESKPLQDQEVTENVAGNPESSQVIDSKENEKPVREKTCIPVNDAEKAGLTGAKIQWFITHAMKQQLADLGYPREVVKGMKPEAAAEIIRDERTYAARPRPDDLSPDEIEKILDQQADWASELWDEQQEPVKPPESGVVVTSADGIGDAVKELRARKLLEDPPYKGAAVKCDHCQKTLSAGTLHCSGCGAFYTLSYWKANYGVAEGNINA